MVMGHGYVNVSALWLHAPSGRRHVHRLLERVKLGSELGLALRKERGPDLDAAGFAAHLLKAGGESRSERVLWLLGLASASIRPCSALRRLSIMAE